MMRFSFRFSRGLLPLLYAQFFPNQHQLAKTLNQQRVWGVARSADLSEQAGGASERFSLPDLR
jgi:hypothetical protein